MAAITEPLHGSYQVRTFSDSPWYSLEIDDTLVFIEPGSVRLGPYESWPVRRRWRRRSLVVDNVGTVEAKLLSSNPEKWAVTDAAGSYVMAVEETVRRREKGRDLLEVMRRHAVVSVSGHPDQIGRISLVYQHEAHGLDHSAAFDGVVSLERSLSLPVTLLCLYLSLGPWASRRGRRRVGEWHDSPYSNVG